MERLKLSNFWEVWPELCATEPKFKPFEMLANVFSTSDGRAMRAQPKECTDYLMRMFSNSQLFRGMFGGYTEREADTIAAMVAENGDGFKALSERLAKTYEAWTALDGPKRTTDEDFKKYLILVNETNMAQEAFDRINAKATNEKLRKDHVFASKWRAARAEINKAERKTRQFIHNTLNIVKGVRSLGLEASKSETTAVKGWHTITDGYSISEGDIELYGGTGVEKYSAILAWLKSNGYEIESTEKPWRSGKGMRANIRVKPWHDEDALKERHRKTAENIDRYING
jgi:hypothetical protein